MDERIVVTPLAFSHAVRHWLATSPAERPAAPLLAARSLVETTEKTVDGSAFERELLRLVFDETGPGHDGQAEGAHVLLHLWQALGQASAHR